MKPAILFTLDPKLREDSLFIAELTLSQLRLFNKCEVLNLILIPKVPKITELYQLTKAQSIELNQEIATVSRLLKTHFPCDKLNIASLGNLVPQLHIHIIARRYDDPFWPKPVFGLLKKAYSSADAQTLIEKLQALCQ